MIAGRAWPQPLDEGAHLMTMSTYKSLGGPASGLIVTNDPRLAEKLDAIASFEPGMSNESTIPPLYAEMHYGRDAPPPQ